MTTTQLRIIDPAPATRSTPKLDRRTRELGLKGVAQAREALRRAAARTAA